MNLEEIKQRLNLADLPYDPAAIAERLDLSGIPVSPSKLTEKEKLPEDVTLLSGVDTGEYDDATYGDVARDIMDRFKSRDLRAASLEELDTLAGFPLYEEAPEGGGGPEASPVEPRIDEETRFNLTMMKRKAAYERMRRKHMDKITRSRTLEQWGELPVSTDILGGAPRELRGDAEAEENIIGIIQAGLRRMQHNVEGSVSSIDELSHLTGEVEPSEAAAHDIRATIEQTSHLPDDINLLSGVLLDDYPYLDKKPDLSTGFPDTINLLSGAPLAGLEESEEAADALVPVLAPWVQPFQAVGFSASMALNAGMAGFATHLDVIADMIEAETGVPAGGFFEKCAKTYEENTVYWQKRANEVGATFLEELFGSAIGGAVPGISEFMLNIPYYGLLGAAEAHKQGGNVLIGSLMAAAERGALGLVFRSIHGLKQYLRAPVMGSIFGLQSAKEGGTPQEIAMGFGTGMIYSASSRGGRIGLNDLYERIKLETNTRERSIIKEQRSIEEYQDLFPDISGVQKPREAHYAEYKDLATNDAETFTKVQGKKVFKTNALPEGKLTLYDKDTGAVYIRDNLDVEEFGKAINQARLKIMRESDEGRFTMPEPEFREALKNTEAEAERLEADLSTDARDKDLTRESDAVKTEPATPEKPAAPEKPASPTAGTKQAGKFRELADKMQPQIDNKLHPATADQNPTPRRARIIEGMRQDGERMKKVQTVLRGMADDIEAGTLPGILTGLKSKADVEAVLTRSHLDEKRAKRLNITDQASLDAVRAECERYIRPPTEEELQAKRRQELERELIGTKIPGFFPTPKKVAEQIVGKADIQEGERVLEPSAGKGDIADSIRARGHEPDVLEINTTLSALLEEKGYSVKQGDFLEETGKYDKIIMNPPFEKSQDIAHVQHAYDLLNPGGRLVAIMSEGSFFRNDKKATAFRQWLEEVGGESEQLPEGAFTGAEAFRQTGVNARVVTIDKPRGAPQLKDTPWLMTSAEYIAEMTKGEQPTQGAIDYWKRKHGEEVSWAAWSEQVPRHVLEEYRGSEWADRILKQYDEGEFYGLIGRIRANGKDAVSNMGAFLKEHTGYIEKIPYGFADYFREKYPALYKELSERDKKYKIVHPTEDARKLIDQKKYLIAKVDEELKKAPSDLGKTDALEEGKEFIVFHVPHDGSYTVKFNKESLKEFRKALQKYPTVEKPKPGKHAPPRQKPTGKRITGEDVQYYNEFRPRQQEIIEEEHNYYLKDGSFTTGHYIVKISKSRLKIADLLEGDKAPPQTMKDFVPDRAEPAFLAAEYHAGTIDTVVAHVVSETGRSVFLDARYVDVILTEYPKARPLIDASGHNEKQMVAFENPDGKVVGVVAMLTDSAIPKEARNFVVNRAREVLAENKDLRHLTEKDVSTLFGTPEKESAGKEPAEKEPSEEGAAMGFRPQKGYKGTTEKTEPAGEGADTGEPMGRREIVQFLREKLEIPIRTGRYRDRSALGLFYIEQEMIRSRSANDVPTICHEAGHALHKYLWGRTRGGLPAKPLQQFADELTPIASQPRPGQSPLPEGFAEFVRMYVTAPEQARKAAPRFYDHFEELLNLKAPEVKSIFLEARRMYKRYLEQDDLKAVVGQISTDQTGDRKTTWTDFYTACVDDLYPMKKAVKEMMRGEKLPTERDPYQLQRLVRGWHGKPAAFLRHSPFKFRTYEDVGKSLQDILKPLGDRLDEFRAYIVSKRGLELFERKKNIGLNKERMERVVARYDKDFGQAFEELKEYQDHVLAYLRDSGVVSDKMLTHIRKLNQDYVPLYRVFEPEEVGMRRPGTGRGFEARNPIKSIKGSEREIIDPLESIVKNTYLYINLAEKNACGQALTRLAGAKEGLGKWVFKIPTPIHAAKMPAVEALQQIKKSLELLPSDKAIEFQVLLDDMIAHGKTVSEILKKMNDPKFMSEQGIEGIKSMIEAAGLKPEDLRVLNSMVAIFQPSAFVPRDNVITVWRDGKRQLYEVHEDIARTFQALDEEMTSALVRFLAVPASWLRIGATTTPDFIIRNLERDTLTAFVYSNYGFLPVVDTVRGMFHLVKRDDLYWTWRKAGGEHSMLVSMDRQYLKDSLGDLIQKYQVKNVIKHPLEAVRVLSEIAESGSRLGEFERGVKKEMAATGDAKAAAQRAAFSSREVTLDFAKKGAKTKAVNMMIAFFQAQINGTDRMVRAFKDNPVRTSLRTLTAITLPSVLLTLSQRDDPRWGEIEQWKKDLFWIVLTDNNIYYIPKPFELGILFGTVPERITEYLCEQDPHAFDDLLGAIWRGAAPGIVPTAAAPWIENWANKSMFLDRPILPKSMENILPEYQYKRYTTETAKILGKYLSKIPILPDATPTSPAMVENVVRSWTGGSGQYALGFIDHVLRKTGVVKEEDYEEPTRHLADWPIFRAFVVRYPSTNAESIRDFYDNYEKIEKVQNTAKYLISEEHDYDKAMGLMMEGSLVRLNKYADSLANIRDMIDAIYIAPSMTGDEKRAMIDQLIMQMVAVAQQGNAIYDELEQMGE
jgi:hypothetical protein